MVNQKEKIEKSRLRSSYFSVIISVTLVLFLMGVLGVLVLNAKSVSDHLKENFTFTVVLKDSAKMVDVKQLQKTMELADYVRDTKYISKEESSENLKAELGEDFLEFVGYNPLPNAIDIRLKADFVTPERMAAIEKEILAKKFVSEVIYDKPLIEQMTANLKRISLGLLVFCGVFGIISIFLISSSIRLAVYSKRFTIRTMQLVGATKRFIRKPFIWASVRNGLISAFIALSVLTGIIYYLQDIIPGFAGFNEYRLMGMLYAGIILTAVIITWVSTSLSMRKFLKMTTDDLYY